MQQKQHKTLLRFATAGSVDDGKSTLLGRLLFETKSIYEDQLKAIEDYSRRRGKEEVALSLLLDGLAAEREQGITIDVAYRYFETEKRKFIVADTPGHEQYTRNMVTGASTADLAIVLIDARKGVLTQSKRHGFLISLLGIPHLVVAINKMDLVDYAEEVFNEIVAEYVEFSRKLSIQDITFIPLSAYKGDNVAHRSQNMPWYDGETLLYYLEHVRIMANRNLVDFRLPVQTVIRPDQNFRGFAGTVASGVIRPGEEVVVLPSNRTSVVDKIVTYDGEMEQGRAGDAIVLTLKDEVDVSRGDMICRVNNLPIKTRHLNTYVCWMHEDAMNRNGHYLLKHGSRTVKAYVSKLHYRIDVNTLHRDGEVESLALNDIGRVDLTTTEPLFADPYASNRSNGAFILIDPLTTLTVAAGMIRGQVSNLEDMTEHKLTTKSQNVVWQGMPVGIEEYNLKSGHQPAVLWFTGLSGSGKSTIAKHLVRQLFDANHKVVLLDGDNVRHGLCGDLGFDLKDRSENIRRVGEVAKLFYESGHIVVATFISPLLKDRDLVRSILPQGKLHEIYVKCSLETCKQRDVKGLYAKALAGQIKDFTGISSPYEEPHNPALVVESDSITIEESLEMVMEYLNFHHILRNL